MQGGIMHSEHIDSSGSTASANVKPQTDAQRNDAKYHQLFNSMEQGAFIQRADGTFSDCNPALLKMLGLTREEFLSRKSMDQNWKVIREDGSEMPRTEHPSMQAIHTGQPILNRVAGVFNPADQDYRWININATPIFDSEESSPHEAFVTLYDITAQRKAEAALQLSEEKYRSLYENAPQAYQSLDINGHFIDINPGWCRILGYDREEVIGRSFAEFLHPDWRPHFEKNFPAFKARGYVSDVQFKLRHKSGRFVDVEFNGCIGYLPDGSFRQTYCVFQDITQRKKAEDQLRDERLRLENIIKSTNVGTWEWNVQSGEITINKRWAEIIGYTMEELGPITIDSCKKHFHPDDFGLSQTAIKKHFSGELEHYESEVRMKHKNGSWVWVLDNGQLLNRTEDGQPLMMMGTHLDVTERHHMQERLQQTEKMDAIGQLAGGVAHDFNNQLGGILGFADLLADQLTDPELVQYAQHIIKASQRAAELTSQLLAFGRKGKNLNVPVDIHLAIGDVVSMLERSIDKRICIEQKLCASSSITDGDPSQLYNALLNLGINARDAMPASGTLTYETELRHLDAAFIEKNRYDFAPGCYIRISVSDTGCGMSKAVQQKAFEPFFTTKAEGKGTGLGLSSVYGTIKNHGGGVSIYSEPGQGTTFRLYLPVAESELAKEPLSAPKTEKGSGRILVVDDEEIMQYLAAALLHSLGYESDACTNGQEAVEYYRKHWQQIDLVILDMVMPGLDGRQTFAALQKINPHIRAILSSGYSMNENVQEILDDGVAAYIGKPFGRQELSEKITQVLLKK
jgi:PAS domain S-box-containing protein